MKSKTIYCVAALFGIYYFTKSAVNQFFRFKALSGERSSINYLLKMIQKQDQKGKDLQFYTRMYITGSPNKISNLKHTNSELKNYFIISQQKLKLNQDNFQSTSILDRAPIFNLKDVQGQHISVQVNTLNEFTFDFADAKILSKTEMSVYKAIFFHLNLIRKEVKFGLPYNQQYLIFGDFIHNPETQVLRCYKIRKLTKTKQYAYLRFEFYITNIITMIFKIGMIASLSYYLYQCARKLLSQDMNFSNVLISQYHQTLTCFICKKERANIIFEPCFHLNCCLDCSKNQVNCPICEKFISKQKKVFND